MKTRFSKKLISILLSLLMVVSSLPMMAITTQAETQWELIEDSTFNSNTTCTDPTGSGDWKTKHYPFVTEGQSSSIWEGHLYGGNSENHPYSINSDGLTINDGFLFTSSTPVINGLNMFKMEFEFSVNSNSNLGGNSNGESPFIMLSSYGDHAKYDAGMYANNTSYNLLSFDKNGRVYANNNSSLVATFDPNMKPVSLSSGSNVYKYVVEYDGTKFNISLYTNGNLTNSKEIQKTIETSNIKKVYLTNGGVDAFVKGLKYRSVKFYKGVDVKPKNINGTFSKANYGIIRGGNTSRIDGEVLTIVNDQEADNTSAGIIKYDISKLQGYKVTSATLNAKIDSYNTEKLDTSFYYSLDDSKCSQYTENSSKNVSLTYGTGTTGRDSCLSILGSDSSKLIGTITKEDTNYNYIHMESALNDAISQGKKYIYIIIVKSSAGTNGAGNGGGWSDTKITVSNQTITYQAELPSYTRTEVANAKKNLTAKTFSNYPYSGTMTSTQDGSYSKSTLTGGDEMLNVLYSYGVGGSSAFKDCGDSNYSYIGSQWGDITLLWDGVNKMACPINYFHHRTKSIWPNNGDGWPISVYVRARDLSDNSAAYLQHAWHGYEDSAKYATGTTYTLNYVDSHTTLNPYKPNDNTNRYYSNTLYIDGSKLNFNGAKRITVPIYWKSLYQGDGGTKSREVSDDSHASVRVINYAPVANAIREGKKIYNTVSNDEYSYCPTDLYNFYTALDKLMSFNPNNYFAYNNNGYAACCTAMEALDPYITPAKSPLTKSNTSINHSYTNGEIKNAQKHIIHCNDCGEDIEEACSFTLTNTVDATCTATGTKTYTCSKCSGTVTETISMSEHNWGAWNGDYSSTKHTRQCQDCKAWDEYYLCELVDIKGKDATCTEEGLTVGKVCSVCNKIRTAQTTIPAKGHSYAIAGDRFVCSIDGDVKKDKDKDVEIDLSAYNSAKAAAQVEIENNVKYTVDSRNELFKAVMLMYALSPKEDTQETVNTKTNNIIKATKIKDGDNGGVLELNEYDVTFNVIVGEDDDLYYTETINNVAYGTALNLEAKEHMPVDSFVYKWVAKVIVNEESKETKISSTSNKVSYVVYNNTTINCFVTKEEMTAEKTVKVTLMDKSNHIAGIAYVASGSTFTKDCNVLTVDGQTLTAPKYPFYQVKDFCLEDTNTVITDNGYRVEEDIIVKPVYSAESQIEITTTADDVTINKVVRNKYIAKWDQTITVYNENATAWYANGVLVATGNTYKFQATQSVEITYDSATVTEGKSRIDYAKYEGEFGYSRIVVSNCVPTGATVVEQGIKILTSSKENVPSVASSKVIAGTKKFVASKITDTGLQFMFTLTTDEAVKTIAVVSFVTYELNGETKTVWSSEGDTTATMIHKTNA